MLERPAIEEQRAPLAAEQRGGLVEDPGWDAHGAAFRALARERKVERRDLELRDGAEREGDDHLERAGGAEPGSLGKVGVDRAVEADGRAAELGELLCDGGGVAPPAPRLASAVRGQLDPLLTRDEADPVGRFRGQSDAQVDRDGEDEPTA